jgi:hypothetical protein
VVIFAYYYYNKVISLVLLEINTTDLSHLHNDQLKSILRRQRPSFNNAITKSILFYLDHSTPQEDTLL